MNFALSEDQIMIRDAAENFLADASDSAAVRAACDSDSGYDAAVWDRISSELGWCAMALPERYGGLGLGAVELVLLFEQMGRRLLCAPYFPSIALASPLLMEVGTAAAQERFLSQIASGMLRMTAPMGADGWSTRVRATRTPQGWTLQGVVRQAPDAMNADWVLVLAQTEDAEDALFAVPLHARGLCLRPHRGWDLTRRFADIELEAVAVAGEDRIDEPAGFAQGLLRALATARLCIAAEQLGGAQQCLDLTVSYAATRKQFGRAIAGFQAVKHRCAQMMVQVESLRSAVYGAAAQLAARGDAGEVAMECAMARTLATEAFFFCAQEAIQLHGGVGFTWEYDPQLYFKRAQASSHWLGNADEMRENIAQALFAGSPA